MRKLTQKKPMAPVLDDLLNDGRLTRLFSEERLHCALQLWVLQIKNNQSVENRIIYGRLLPYSYSNDKWSFSDNDKFTTIGDKFKAKVIRLNLYVKSKHCANLLRQLSSGGTISEISEVLQLEFPNDLKNMFESTALAADELVYRPVAFLLNRDAHDLQSLSSPHSWAGAFSASITQADKGVLFCLDQDYDVALTELVIKHLNADTGLDFGGTDTGRFGDIELLVFPALDDMELSLLNVCWNNPPYTLVATFNPKQVPNFSGFLFRLSITNGGQIVHSGIATAERNADGVFECKFELSDQLRAMTDSTELEIFGFHGDQFREGSLCCRWRMGYIREVHYQIDMAEVRASPVKFDWLEKTTRPSELTRVKAALTINRGNQRITNMIGGRETDPWVRVNSDLKSLFVRLNPTKSEGRFFLRWGQSDWRLQFVEWFRTLLIKYQQHQIGIFDPYFEDAGLGLLLICASANTDYLVFRSLSKPVKQDKPMRRKSDRTTGDGINNLLANCEHNRNRLKRFKLRIYGLKEGRLHDRYILIMGQDRLPVAGFNLSNSFQKAAENYPLLVTPIPPDVLPKVGQYMFQLVKEARAVQPEGKITNPTIQCLFDSSELPTEQLHYEPLSFIERTQAGDVLGVWTGELSLRGLSGDSLKERMTELELLKKDGSLALFDTKGLLNCLDNQPTDDFTQTWEVLGEMLAHSHIEDYRLRDLEFKRGLLDFLLQYLDASFNRALDLVDNELATIEARFFQEPIDVLLHSAYDPQHFYHWTKYIALTWPEFYAIKFLWWYDPDVLLATAKGQMTVSMEPQASDAMRQSLLSQIISEIALSVQFDINERQLNQLINSGNGLLHWMGLNAIEMQLAKPEGLGTVLQWVAVFTPSEKVRVLGWMIHRAARIPQKADIYRGLVNALHEALPATINAEQLKCLVDSMRGHMQQLAWAEPWLFEDVVLPLLQNGQSNINDASEIWVQELAHMLEPQLPKRPQLFDCSREGRTTNITAYLFAYSSPEQQRGCLKSMQAILKRQKQIVQQPLASTSNWSRWNEALTVSLWVLAFARWGQYYLRGRGLTDCDLEGLSRSAHELAMVRPMHEWRSKGIGEHRGLPEFLDEVEERLSSSDEWKSIK